MFTLDEWAFLSISLVTCFLSVVGNAFVCRVICLKKAKSSVYRLIYYQALSDILYTVTRPLGFILCYQPFTELAPAAFLACEVVNVTFSFTSYVISALTMTVIAYYRFTAVYFAHVGKPSILRIKVVTAGVWLFGLVVGYFSSIGFEFRLHGAHIRPAAMCIKTFAAIEDGIDKRVAHRVALVMGSYLPFFVTTAFYLLIMIKINRISMVGESSAHRARSLSAHKLRVIKMLLTMVISYYLLLMPITFTLHGLSWELELDHYTICNRLKLDDVVFLSFVLLGLSTVINPYILYVFDPMFRDEVKKTTHVVSIVLRPKTKAPNPL
ncbi:hypothetical protein HDE_04321 [Halotydeus destructor]|nr:hypothetical protein HDE_04321 [Halotydeus destructor]